MREETKYQSSPYLDEVDALKRELRKGSPNLDNHHPLTINAVAPELLRVSDKKVLSEEHGFTFETEAKAKSDKKADSESPKKKPAAKKASPAKRAAKKKAK